MTGILKIFFDDRCLVLCLKGIKIGDTPPNSSGGDFESDHLEGVLRRFISGEDIPPQNYFSLCALEQAQCKVFRLIDAAGGVVLDREGRVLLIHRFGRWDLPKGKSEKGECAQETAIREVMEECGLSSMPTIGRFLTNSWHIYPTKGGLVLKKTAWYQMIYEGADTLTPQKEEGISQACWCDKGSISDVIADTYPSLREVFSVAGLVN